MLKGKSVVNAVAGDEFSPVDPRDPFLCRKRSIFLAMASEHHVQPVPELMGRPDLDTVAIC